MVQRLCGMAPGLRQWQVRREAHVVVGGKRGGWHAGEAMHRARLGRMRCNPRELLRGCSGEEAEALGSLYKMGRKTDEQWPMPVGQHSAAPWTWRMPCLEHD